MEDNIFDKVHEVDLKKTMETLYRLRHECYCSRALPDVRDGLKAGTETNPVLHDRAEQRS